MRQDVSITEKEVIVIIFLSMIFAICESLSIELNNFFRNYNIYGYNFSFNVSVIFFCIGFFIIDLVTEIYNKRFADYFIYAKLVSQLGFILLGKFGTTAAGIAQGQISQTFTVAPYNLCYAMIASFVGYQLTASIMQKLKIRFKGKFLSTRYLSSTIPGEIVFSLLFTLLSFSHGRGLSQIINIFVGLILIKFIFSAVFSILVVPVTNLIKYYLGFDSDENKIPSLPFS